jgi:hypothetical protein
MSKNEARLHRQDTPQRECEKKGNTQVLQETRTLASAALPPPKIDENTFQATPWLTKKKD